MNSMTKQKVWYGELRTSRGNSIVIHDQALPEASSGRIYLYNSNRQAIIEYVQDIVESNLHDLDEVSLKQAQKNYSDAWKSAKSDFLNQQKGHLERTEDVTTIPSKIIAHSDDISAANFDNTESDFDKNEWNDEEYEE